MVLRTALVMPTKNNPLPWVVVTNPGEDNEDFFSDHATFAEARKGLKECREWMDCPADIMRRLDDGTLTTEF